MVMCFASCLTFQDTISEHIAEGLSCQLVTLAGFEDHTVAISAGQLLRSITVNSIISISLSLPCLCLPLVLSKNHQGKNSTLFQPLILDILNILKKAPPDLKIALAATIWGLSSFSEY
jgi:hypothetical protein